MRKSRVIAAGHICLDLTPKFTPGCEFGGLQALLRPGSLVRVDGCDVHTGGCVANTGLALKKMGLDVLLMGKAGTDAFGDMLSGLLDAEGAGGLIRDARSPTSYSVILAPPGVDRIFLHDPGANDTFSEKDIPDAALREARLIHFGYPPLMRNMTVKDGAQLKRLFERAHENGCAVSLDMAAVDPAAEAGKADWKMWLRNCMPQTDLFLPSFEEICFMLDRERFESLCREGGDMTDRIDPERDALPLAEQLVEMGAACAVIKCGTKGLVLVTGNRERMKKVPGDLTKGEEWVGRRITRSCLKAERVLSATGAGDSAIAAFLCAALEGRGPEDCLFFAAAQGARCVTAWDAVSALLPIKDLEKEFSAQR